MPHVGKIKTLIENFSSIELFFSFRYRQSSDGFIDTFSCSELSIEGHHDSYANLKVVDFTEGFAPPDEHHNKGAQIKSRRNPTQLKDPHRFR